MPIITNSMSQLFVSPVSSPPSHKRQAGKSFGFGKAEGTGSLLSSWFCSRQADTTPKSLELQVQKWWSWLLKSVGKNLMSAKQVLSRRNPWTWWTWTAGCIYPSSLYAASFWVLFTVCKPCNCWFINLTSKIPASRSILSNNKIYGAVNAEVKRAIARGRKIIKWKIHCFVPT